MKNHTELLKYGYFSEFKAEDVFLFSGDSHALGKLAQFFDDLSNAKAHTTVVLDEAHGFLPTRNSRLVLEISDGNASIRPDNTVSAGLRSFVWKVPSSQLKRFAALTRAVAESDRPAHHYIDLDGDHGCDVSIIVSHGEYGEEVFNSAY